ncbi:MAG TPA: recombination protein RecR [Sutterella sp.]|nr:recombination protein RecR [Sutterella sp.]
MVSGTDPRIANLTELFSELPGLGPRSASRLVADLLTEHKDLALSLARSLEDTVSRIGRCRSCNTLCTQDICPICAKPDRDRSIICVVESSSDMAAIEESVSYTGSYFVLVGRVNPLKGVGPEDIGVDKLVARVISEKVCEVVLATSYTAEGEMTAHMIASVLKRKAPSVRVTRLSKGLSAGVEVEYTDPATLTAAVLGRR